jgi:hypothetical protein
MKHFLLPTAFLRCTALYGNPHNIGTSGKLLSGAVRGCTESA